jgi:hypothetical protein
VARDQISQGSGSSSSKQGGLLHKLQAFKQGSGVRA